MSSAIKGVLALMIGGRLSSMSGGHGVARLR